MEAAALSIFALLGIFLVVPLIIVWKGFALSILWGWFVSPLFGVPPLSIPAAIGICTIVGLVRYRYEETGDKKASFKPLAMQIINPAFVLGVGWIVKTYFL